MEVGTKKFLRDDQTSDYRSMCSNYYPSIQSRKISVGILVDSTVKKNIGSGKDDVAAVRKVERENSNGGKSAEGKNKEEQVKAAIKGKQTKVPEQAVASPWISTRSCQPEAPPSENNFNTKESSLSFGSGRKKKLSGLKDAPVAPSVQVFGNQALTIQPGDTNLNKFSGISYKRKSQQDKSSQREDGFAFPIAQENLVSDKQVTADKTETLKLKLWEILGNVTSPKSQPSNSQAQETAADKLKPAKIRDEKVDTAVRSRHSQVQKTAADKLKPAKIGDEKVDTAVRSRHSQAQKKAADKLKSAKIGDEKVDTAVRSRQDSDTIETDSESSDKKLRRPITRFSTRNRVPTKRQSVKSKAGPSSSTHKQKHHEMNKFTSTEEWLSKIDGANNSGTTLPARKGIQRESSTIAPRKICFTEKENSDKNEETTRRSQASPPAFKTSSEGKKVGDTHSYSFDEKTEYPDKKSKAQDSSFYQSPLRKTNQQQEFFSPVLPENHEQQEDISRSSFENAMDPQDNYQSPTFRINTPISTPGLSPTPEANQMEDGDCSPLAGRIIYTMENISSFKSFQTAKSDSSRLFSQPESSDDEEELKDSSSPKPTPTNEKKDMEEDLPGSSSEEEEEDKDSESSEEGSPVIKGRRGKEASPEIVTSRKSKFSLRPTKRLRQQEDTEFNEFSPPWPSSKGVRESDWNHEPSEQTEEGDLTRVVTLLSLALENFKRKMTLAAQKKSSEILLSASDGMQLQLQNVQSQIQMDMEKLATFSKSKRKRVETKFQEQQQQLKLIHEKFKDDLQQHLQDCKGTLEGLEGHKIELKETAKKQKASHQELLSHVEESVESQLSDAQRRIQSVHKLAKEKMLQLKQVIAQCLKEGI